MYYKKNDVNQSFSKTSFEEKSLYFEGISSRFIPLNTTLGKLNQTESHLTYALQKFNIPISTLCTSFL